VNGNIFTQKTTASQKIVLILFHQYKHSEKEFAIKNLLFLDNGRGTTVPFYTGAVIYLDL
jgi:hypothetical protein